MYYDDRFASNIIQTCPKLDLSIPLKKMGANKVQDIRIKMLALKFTNVQLVGKFRVISTLILCWNPVFALGGYYLSKHRHDIVLISINISPCASRSHNPGKNNLKTML